jgi:hypothetical protein
MEVNKYADLNAPILIRNMIAEERFDAFIQTIVPGEDGVKLADQLKSRSLKDQVDTARIIRAMLPELIKLNL